MDEEEEIIRLKELKKTYEDQLDLLHSQLYSKRKETNNRNNEAYIGKYFELLSNKKGIYPTEFLKVLRVGNEGNLFCFMIHEYMDSIYINPNYVISGIASKDNLKEIKLGVFQKHFNRLLERFSMGVDLSGK